MRKYFMYLLIYSVGGFILERIINFFAFYDRIAQFDSVIDYIIHHDNSVLYGPYQPLYGLGVVLAVLIWEKFLINDTNIIRKNILLVIVAIVATGLSEAFHGYGYEFLTGVTLWDYRDFFPCSIPYVCIYPTTMFGIASFFVIKFIHPFVKRMVSILPKIAINIIFLIFTLDIIITYFVKIA